MQNLYKEIIQCLLNPDFVYNVEFTYLGGIYFAAESQNRLEFCTTQVKRPHYPLSDTFKSINVPLLQTYTYSLADTCP
jgi:hypothetical protein